MEERMIKLRKKEKKKNRTISQNTISRLVQALCFQIHEEKSRKTNYVPAVAQHISLLIKFEELCSL